MILGYILVLASFQTAESPMPAQESDEIVITGERLKRIRVTTKHDRKTGQQRCIVKRSSGDPVLDTTFCGTVLACAQSARKSDEMSACVAKGISGITRRRPPFVNR